MKKALLIVGLALTLLNCNTPRPATTPNTTDPAGTGTGTGTTTDTTGQRR